MNYNSNKSYKSNEMLNQDIESFIKYTNEKILHYEEDINGFYINIKSVLNSLEEEYPMIDITSILYCIYLFSDFSDFLSICEEYYNVIQYSSMFIYVI